MKKGILSMDIDGVLVDYSKSLESSPFKERAQQSIKQILQQQEVATNMKWLFLNRNNESNKDLIQFVGKNSIKVMFVTSQEDEPVRELSKEGEQLTTPISRTQLQHILKNNSPQPLDNEELEQVLNTVYSPIISKTNFIDRVKSSKLDIFIDDNPSHITPFKK